MITLSKRIIAVAAVIAAAAAPSTASARLIAAAPDSGPVGAAVPIQAPSATPQQQAGTSQGFQWDDAGIGAAGVLVLVGAGAGAVTLAGRRRTHEARVS